MPAETYLQEVDPGKDREDDLVGLSPDPSILGGVSEVFDIVSGQRTSSSVRVTVGFSNISSNGLSVLVSGSGAGSGDGFGSLACSMSWSPMMKRLPRVPNKIRWVQGNTGVSSR